VKTVRKQREVPIEFKFACSYVYNCFAEPWFIWTVLAECIFIILFLIKEYLVSRL
jgi:hypothetical protein